MSWPKLKLFCLLFHSATSTGNRSPKQMEWIDIFTSQWLNTSCGLARPLVLFLISSAKPKLSATGRTALIINTSVPSFISSCSTLPSLLDSTAYTRPAETQFSSDYPHTHILHPQEKYINICSGRFSFKSNA